MQKPKKLKQGDTVAIVSPSWGGPSLYPRVYENGLNVLRGWGLHIKEFPSAREKAEILFAHPQARAADINDAFADPSVKAIFASIGGKDSVRILPFLDSELLKHNPKILIGFSDTTTLHVFAQLQGLITFYGPSIMAGFSQMQHLPDQFSMHVREMLFEPKDQVEYRAYGAYCEGYPDWGKEENIGLTNPLKTNDGWHGLQGSAPVQGQLFGGCIEVLEMMKATDYWPPRDFWNGKLLFLETSEEKPSLTFIDHVLRNYGMLGIFNRIQGLVFGRARDYTEDEKKRLEKILISVIAEEFGHPNLPIVANVDIGHTDPQFVIPLGGKAELDPRQKRIRLIEPWLS